MEDLLQVQIQDSCRLALPDGLKDLMSDISREVLRAQPKDLLQFITNYLSAMLVTRENLAAASCLCEDIYDNMEAADFGDELSEKGIVEDDIQTIKELVSHYLGKMSQDKPVKEGHLISKILQKTSVDEEHLVHVLTAVRKAFTRHQAYNTTIYEMTPDSSMDEITRAAHHTIDLFRKTKPTDTALSQTAEKIQVAYRAYGVRRQKVTEILKNEWDYAPEIVERAGLEETKEIDAAADLSTQHITFSADEGDQDGYNADTESHYADNRSVATNASEKTEDIYVFPIRISTISSTSLAGSYIDLPKHKPYSILDDTIKECAEPDLEEADEKQSQEHFNVDYTREDTMEATGALLDYEVDNVMEATGALFDYEADDVMEATSARLDYEADDVRSESSVEENIEMGERRVIFVDSIDELNSSNSIDELDY